MGNHYSCLKEKVFAVAIREYFSQRYYKHNWVYKFEVLLFMIVASVIYLGLQAYLLHYLLQKVARIEEKSFHWLMYSLIQVTILLNVVPPICTYFVYEVIWDICTRTIIPGDKDSVCPIVQEGLTWINVFTATYFLQIFFQSTFYLIFTIKYWNLSRRIQAIVT